MGTRLGDYLKHAREDMRPRMSQGALAQTLGRSQSWVSVAELGTITPSPVDLIALVEAINGDLTFAAYLAGYGPAPAIPGSEVISENPGDSSFIREMRRLEPTLSPPARQSILASARVLAAAAEAELGPASRRAVDAAQPGTAAEPPPAPRRTKQRAQTDDRATEQRGRRGGGA